MYFILEGAKQLSFKNSETLLGIETKNQSYDQIAS